MGIKLEEQTNQCLKSGIHVGDFPATLQDSILITRELGLKYVWIDALCIRQESKDDWRAEAGRMRDVYARQKREATLFMHSSIYEFDG